MTTRDFKINSRKHHDTDEVENVPINPNHLSSDSLLPTPLNPNPTLQQPGSSKRKSERTPLKAKPKISDLPLSTPEKHGNATVGRKRPALSSVHDLEVANYLSQTTKNGTSLCFTPRHATYTPARSVSKPPNPGLAPSTSLRHPASARVGSYAGLSRRFTVSGAQSCTVNTLQVPHFDLKEDPSFWMDHNVQVIIRSRPLNSFETNTQGYNRCVKQENAQSITWIGQPETRFTFDHVACETIDQEMLFRMTGLPMVENCLSGYNSCMFAYGQTGSGKTYTMLGEMEDSEFNPSPHRGMMSRIFEFLFARINAEEESRRDEKLRYNCKCSFLEIYNEQITDLLDPTSTNLLLREDTKKGVYVENLSEFEVDSVSDVARLLIQGSSNRKVATTDMNRESSRSHSVFTCIIESKWERDSTTHLRFARLNLVDLAGSERQKSSGAEGERLKEAANINKSLSSLGHVIMLLVDIAQGKPKHVPYRDSRLTFLLQDSLGGNSKTMIIANISPSICCAAETLNTLKFAQRAKLIQNNAVVNEDSAGDVAALQHQVLVLKEELAALKLPTVSRRLAFDPFAGIGGLGNIESTPESDQPNAENLMVKSMENMLSGALRREQMAATSIKELEAEIEQLNCLVHQKEEDTRCTKMMLKFREDKIQRMESLLGDKKTVDAYMLEENAALSEEIQLLRAKDDRNPEVTRFASENIRLQEQLRRFQDFYEEGERDVLLNEVSELRSQLIHFLDNDKSKHCSNMGQDSTHNIEGSVSLRSELTNAQRELSECQSKLKSCLESNLKLNREVEDLHAMMRNKELEIYNQPGIVESVKDVQLPCIVDQVLHTEKGRSKDALLTHAEEILNFELELDILKIMLKEERLSYGKMEEMVASSTQNAQLAKERVLLVSKQFEDAKKDLGEAKSVIEALESQQSLSIKQVEELKNCNAHYLELLHKQELETSVLKEQSFRSRNPHMIHSRFKDSPLQLQLERMQASLDKAKFFNTLYLSDHDAQRSNEEEMDKIRRQAEAETAEVIVSLQEELSMLQHQMQVSDSKEKEAENKVLILETNSKELQESLMKISQDNEALHQSLMEKDREIQSVSEDWKILCLEIETALLDGNKILESVCDQVDLMSCPMSDKRVWISEQLEKMIRHMSMKESIIQELNRGLEDASTRKNDMEQMLLSLRGAAIVTIESHEQEIKELRSELEKKTSSIAELERRIKLAHDEMMKTSTCVTAAFVVVNRLSEKNISHIDALRVMDIQLRELQEMNLKKDVFLCEKSTAFDEAQRKIEALEVKSCDNCTTLRQQLDDQQSYIRTMQNRVEENDEYALSKTKEIWDDIKMGVTMVRSSLNEYRKQVGYPERHKLEIPSLRGFSCERALLQTSSGTEETCVANSSLLEQLETDTSDTVSREEMAGALVAQSSLELMKSFNRNCRKDTVFVLLRKEIKSVLGILREVQAEIASLSAEKKEISLSEERGHNIVETVKLELLNLEAAYAKFEGQCESKIIVLNQKLYNVEERAEEAKHSWLSTKELHEFELQEAKTIAAQKTTEYSCFLDKFNEGRSRMEDADRRIDELMLKNKTLKLEIGDIKQTNVCLTSERNSLISGVQKLQSLCNLKDQNCKHLAYQFELDVLEITSLVEDLEGSVLEVQGTCEEALGSFADEFNFMKSQNKNVVKLMQSLIEEISSEILTKDCALSVAHLCQMGVLLDEITRLNSDNDCFHVAIDESNAVISNLREENMKSKIELETYQVLHGKLLADITKSFDSISSKEGETRELSMKLHDFKKKLEILQHQGQLMLERSNIMDSELAIITEKLDHSNSTAIESLLEQERLLKSNEQETETQVENFMLELNAKDFELVMLTSELEQLAHRNADMEKEQNVWCSTLDYLMADIVALRIVADLKEQILLERETQVNCLQTEAEEAKNVKEIALAQLQELEDECKTCRGHLSLKEMENESLINKLQEMESSNSTAIESLLEQERLLKSNEQETETQVENFMSELNAKDFELVMLASELEQLAHRNADMEKEQNVWCSTLDYLMADIVALRIVADMKEQIMLERETQVICLQTEAEEAKNVKEIALAQLQELEDECKTCRGHMSLKEMENESLINKLQEMEIRNCTLLGYLEEKESESKSLKDSIDTLKLLTCKLEADISTCESSSALLEKDLKVKNAEVDDMTETLCKKRQELKSYGAKANAFQEEIFVLRDKLSYVEQSYFKVIGTLSSKVSKCIDSMEAADLQSRMILEHVDKNTKMFLDKVSQNACQNQDTVSGFLQELEFVESNAKGLVSENLSLQKELSRKDEVLQECEANSKGQKDEIEKLTNILESTRDELAVRSREVVDAIAYGQTLEVRAKEHRDIITALETDLETTNQSVKLLSDKNAGLRSDLEDITAAQASAEGELAERRSAVDSMENEVLEMGSTLRKMNDLVESLKSDLVEVSSERDRLQKELVILEEKVETVHALAEENETIAGECQQIAESRRIYAEEKGEEVRLLERSVLELDSTISVLENKVDNLREDFESQKVKRRELELELHSLKAQRHTFESANTEMKRCLDEKSINLEEALNKLKIVEDDIVNKDREIAQCKGRISELTLDLEKQTSKLGRADSLLLQVTAELVQHHARTGTSHSISVNATRRLNNKLKGTERKT